MSKSYTLIDEFGPAYEIEDQKQGMTRRDWLMLIAQLPFWAFIVWALINLRY
ncbi:MAG: hypothetical protein AB7J46_06250 [Candidatus Altimarinota bacterium]